MDPLENISPVRFISYIIGMIILLGICCVWRRIRRKQEAATLEQKLLRNVLIPTDPTDRILFAKKD